MDAALRFNTNIKELSDSEYTQLLLSRRRHVTKILFAYHVKSLTFSSKAHKYAHKSLEAWNQTLNTIIRSRDEKENSNGDATMDDDHEQEEDVDTENNVKLSDLQLVCVANIASFLELRDATRLELANKNLFFGVRALKVMPVINWRQFARCVGRDHRALRLRGKHFSELHIDLDAILRRCGEHACSADDIESCLYNALDALDTKYIRKLCVTFGLLPTSPDISQDKRVPLLARILNTTFPNLSDLQMVGCWQVQDFLAMQLQRFLIGHAHTNNLQYLHCSGYGFVHSVCTNDANALATLHPVFNSLHGLRANVSDVILFLNSGLILHLNSLHVKHTRYEPHAAYNASGHKFTELQELCITFDGISDGNVNILDCIQLNTLKRVCLRLWLPTSRKQCTAFQRQLFRGSMAGLEMIRFACIDTQELDSALDLFTNLLFQCRAKKQMVIELDVQRVYRKMEKIQNFIQVLKTVVDDFVLKLHIIGIKSYKHQMDVTGECFVDDNCDDHTLYISNKECAMNGYQSPWLKRCDVCQAKTITPCSVHFVVVDARHNPAPNRRQPETFYDICSRTPLIHVIGQYCRNNNVMPATVNFFLRGRRIKPNQTALDLKLDRMNIIEIRDVIVISN